MARSSWRVGVGLFLLATIFLAGAYVVPSLSSSAGEDGRDSGCVDPTRVSVDHGRRANGNRWNVDSSVRNNGSCAHWLLGMHFSPIGTVQGSWKGAWDIPSKGHLSRSFTVSAQDESAGAERVISGVTGSRIRTVIVTTNSGNRVTLHPRLPSRDLRSRFVWLRGLRYFVRFYPTGQHAKAAVLKDAQGRVVSTVPAFEGTLEGSM